MYFVPEIKNDIQKNIRHEKYQNVILESSGKIKSQKRKKRPRHSASGTGKSEKMQKYAADVEIAEQTVNCCKVCRKKQQNINSFCHKYI